MIHPINVQNFITRREKKNYSTTERKALAIQWEIKKLRKYLLGAQQFKVFTDHKPLQAMFNKTAGDLPPHIEKFIMDIQEYDYIVEYHPEDQHCGLPFKTPTSMYHLQQRPGSRRVCSDFGSSGNGNVHR